MYALGLPYWDFTLDEKLLNTTTGISDASVFSTDYLGSHFGSLRTGRFARWTISREASVYNISNNRHGRKEYDKLLSPVSF